MGVRVLIALSATGPVTFTVAVRICLDTAGRPASVTLLSSSGYAGHDADLANGVATWRCRPLTVDGEPTPACGRVNVNYRQVKATGG